MKTLTLTEYQTSAVPRELLPETAGQMLYHRYEQQQRVLTIEFPGYKTGDQWQITPGGWVGYVPVGPELALYIQPKVSLDNLFRLLAYGHGLHRFLPGIVQTGSLPAFYSHLAAVLARGVLQRARQGLHSDYLPRQEQLPVVRGRLQLTPAALTRPGSTLTCRYDQHTVDIADNQILHWTLRQIACSPLLDGEAQTAVRRAAHALQGAVSLVPYGAEACRYRPYTRLNEDYAPLHALCHFFLQHSGPIYQVGDRPMLPFLVNMAGLYEAFVAAWLKAHLPAPWRITSQERVAVGDIHLAIDLVLYEGQQARAVLDTKYKAAGRVDPADMHQVIAYAASRGCREAYLIYPQALDRPVDVHLDGLHIRTLTFGLSGDLDENGRALVAQLTAVPIDTPQTQLI